MSRELRAAQVRFARFGIALLLCVGGCDTENESPRLVGGRLWQQGDYQTLYGPDGRLERLLYDRNGDRRADSVVFYGRSGRPERAEVDTDLDGVIDRWESLKSDGSVTSVAYARRIPGRADLWEHAGADGRVVRREIDDDGDGKPDRVELARQ